MKLYILVFTVPEEVQCTKDGSVTESSHIIVLADEVADYWEKKNRFTKNVNFLKKNYKGFFRWQLFHRSTGLLLTPNLRAPKVIKNVRNADKCHYPRHTLQSSFIKHGN
ncbi:unnamed protein product [Allacma fusca]|uniref:Uncharacterized protein n=1 Tax=Allacma fusca TaxID=39272 RepID=A0A8J2K9L7_9HEXA|nr:unnamed protein product [Allacma fusca]